MRLIDRQKLLEWLESEITSTSPADYVTAMKWTSYNIDKGRFDSNQQDTGIQKIRELWKHATDPQVQESEDFLNGIYGTLFALGITISGITDK